MIQEWQMSTHTIKSELICSITLFILMYLSLFRSKLFYFSHRRRSLAETTRPARSLLWSMISTLHLVLKSRAVPDDRFVPGDHKARPPPPIPFPMSYLNQENLNAFLVGRKYRSSKRAESERPSVVLKVRPCH